MAKNYYNTNIQLDEEHQDEVLEEYREFLRKEHLENNASRKSAETKQTAIYVGVMAAGLAVLFREQIAEGVKSGAAKAKSWVKKKMGKEVEPEVDKDGNIVVDAKVSDADKEGN